MISAAEKTALARTSPSPNCKCKNSPAEPVMQSRYKPSNAKAMQNQVSRRILRLRKSMMIGTNATYIAEMKPALPAVV